MKRGTAALASLAVLVSALSLPTAAVAAAAPPDTCGEVQLAEMLTDETRIKRTPAADGSWTPVIFIHGWTGRSTNTKARDGAFSHKIDAMSDVSNGDETFTVNRSLIGAVQNTSGAAVYTFDYHELASRWVDDDGIDIALAEGIKCITDATGRKAVIVAHSMGGLAARQAMSMDAQGVRVGTLVSDVVTFGTPNTGSDIAAGLSAILDGGITAGQVTGNPGVIAMQTIRILLQACGNRKTADNNLKCLGFPPIDSFSSGAGIALRTGSTQLAGLPGWPTGVKLTALYGNTTLSGLDFFGAKLADTNTGDGIVSVPSAKSTAQEWHAASCSYALVATRDARGVLAAAFSPLTGMAYAGKKISGLVKSLSEGPCAHGGLMRNVTLTKWVQAAVKNAVVAAVPVPKAGITWDRIGPVSIGMTTEQFMKLPGASMESRLSFDDTVTCTFLGLNLDANTGSSDIEAIAVNSQIVEIYIDDYFGKSPYSSLRTPENVGLGSLWNDVLEAYPGAEPLSDLGGPVIFRDEGSKRMTFGIYIFDDPDARSDDLNPYIMRMSVGRDTAAPCRLD